MKERVNVLSFMIFLSVGMCGQLKTVWMAQKKVSLDNYGYCVSTGPEGNTYVSGAFSGSYRNPGPTEMGGFVSCYNALGSLQWHKELYAQKSTIRIFNAVDSKGNLIVAGRGLKRFKSDGSLLDSLPIVDFVPFGLCVDALDNVIIAGIFPEDSVMGELVIEENRFLAKFSASGVLEWTQPCYMDRGPNQDFDLAVDHSGNIYTTGGFGGTIKLSEQIELESHGGYDGFVIKYNPEGQPRWAKRFGGDGISYEWPHAITISQNNDVYIAGTYFGVMQAESLMTPQNRGTGELFLMKYDADGGLHWLKSGGGNGQDKLTEITVDDQDNVFICGSYGAPGTFLWDAEPVTVTSNDQGGLFVFQLEADGNPVFFTSGSHGHFRDLTCDNKGNLFLTGEYASPFEFCGKKLEGEGGMCLVKVSYDMNNNVGLQQNVAGENLFHIFPNPGKGSFHISGSICPDAIAVYEASGRVILMKENIECENFMFEFQVPEGIYLVELRKGLTRQTQKIVVQ